MVASYLALDMRCKICFERSYRHLFEKFRVGEVEQKIIRVYFEEVFREFPQLSAPEIQSKLNARFCELLGTNDPFEQEKKESNRAASVLCEMWKPEVMKTPNPFEMALRLSVAGNIMDYGVANHFDIKQTIDKVLHATFAINHVEELRNAVAKANKILYLGDNAGEIVFDKLFLEVMNHSNVVYVVKEAPILNDVTFEDAHAVGMEQVATVISNGDNTPSTLLHRVSDEFLEHFHTADVIISKGQGNLEGIIGRRDARVFFLLMAKCDVIAELLKVDKGSFIVYNQKE